jgi:glycosyltransferase involved in cell wall biosynthesis
MNRTQISVIITDHNRKDYIIECVNSVLQQENISGDLYEIIVVKNYKDEYIDKFLNDNKIKIIETTNKAIGEKFVLGAKNSSSDILCILNDDDLFYPQKLYYVLNIFKQNKNLLYYHNSFIKIDKTSRSIHENTDMKEIIINTNNIKEKLLKQALSGYNIFNDSCITIKKQVIMEYEKELLDVKGNSDTILFLLSLTLNGSLIMDNHKFTKFRLHSSGSNPRSANIDNNIENFNGLIQRRLQSYMVILPVFEKDKLLYKYVKCMLKSNEMQYSIFINTKRSILIRNLFSFIKCPFLISFKSRSFLLIIILIKAINKKAVYKYVSKLIFRYY